MEQYINKSAIMTEIKFLRRVNDGSYYYDGWNQALDRLERFLETIETISREKLINEASDWLKDTTRLLYEAFYFRFYKVYERIINYGYYNIKTNN